MDKNFNQIAHDIAVSLLPKALEELEKTIFVEEPNGFIVPNREWIVGTYEDLYNDLVESLKD